MDAVNTTEDEANLLATAAKLAREHGNIERAEVLEVVAADHRAGICAKDDLPECNGVMIARKALAEYGAPVDLPRLPMPDKLPAVGGVYVCPVRTCGQQWDIAPPTTSYEQRGDMVMVTVSGVDPDHLEKVLHAHMAGHTWRERVAAGLRQAFKSREPETWEQADERGGVW